MTTLEIILTILTALFALVFIIVRTLKTGFTALILKTLASFAFVSSGVLGLVFSNTDFKLTIGLIIVGLLLGMIGDILLDLKVLYDNDKFYLNMGMLSFSLGHVSYFSALSIYALDYLDSLLLPILVAIGGSVLLTIGITLSSKVLKLDFGKFYFQAVGYTVILTFMMVYGLMLSILGGSWLVFIGLLVFFLSDVVLSTQYFGGKIASKPLIAINHLLYYTAQIILLVFTFVL